MLQDKVHTVVAKIKVTFFHFSVTVVALCSKIKSIKCPPNVILSSWDYTNIPHKEGLEAVNKAAMRQPHCPVKPKVLTELAKIVLKK